MTDPVTSARMSAQRTARTAPEDALARELRRLGVRTDGRRNRPIPVARRSGDFVFPRHRVAVMVDGCFWHGCPRHHRPPRTNAAWWEAKVARNRARDRSTTRALRRRGWRVVRIWEHEDPAKAARRVADALGTLGA